MFFRLFSSLLLPQPFLLDALCFFLFFFLFGLSALLFLVKFLLPGLFKFGFTFCFEATFIVDPALIAGVDDLNGL